MKDTISVWAMFGVVTLTLAQAQLIVTMLAAAVSIAYTVHKWRKEK